MNIVCKFLGHKWLYPSYRDNKLKVNISTPVCSRCGKVDYEAQARQIDQFNKTACPKCGAWICHSGCCVFCS